jgi:chromosome segregation protein
MQLVADQARYKNIYQNATTNKENLARRLKRIDEEVALAGKKVAELTQAHADADKQWTIIKGEIEQHQVRSNELKAQLSDQSDRLGKSVKQAHTLDLERNKARSQLSTLKKMAANFDWYRGGVKAVMRAWSGAAKEAETEGGPTHQLKGIAGLMADIIEPEPGYEDALEAVLGEALQYILVEDQNAAATAIDYLQTSGAGRCGFIPLSATKQLPGADPSKIDDKHRLLSHVQVSADYQSIAQTFLGHVAVMPTLKEAIALFNRNGRIQSVVTLAGDVITHQGLILGGSKEQLSGILAKKKELKALGKRCRELDRQVSDAQARQHDLEKVVRDLETSLQESLAAKNHALDEAMDAEKKVYRLGEDLKNAGRHKEIVALEQEQLLGEESDIAEEMSKYQQTLDRIQKEVDQAQNDTAAIADQIRGVSSQWEAYNQKVVDSKLSMTSLNAKLENGQHTLQRLRAFESDSRERLDQLAQEIELKKEKHAAAVTDLSTGEEKLRGMYDSLKELEEKLSAQESDYSAIDKALQEHDEKLADIQSERENTLEKIRVVELDLSEKRIKRENIAGKVQERYHGSIADLRTRQEDDSENLQMSIEEMARELERFRSRISSIGDVNLGAIKEFEELKERFDFLSAQRDDLVKALEDLHKVIRKINRITQERFMETYSKVNAKLKEVFPKLFDGGSARLELTEPDKPLETGVEYLVHPPGKKLTRMSLLSGGEKALSAIAFIFAIFLLRPASFCLLDEIDAPLDDSNVVRFNDLMQVVGQKSQIVMITHNKKSMEFAETLYGVTMEQKGISKIVSVNLSGQA